MPRLSTCARIAWRLGFVAILLFAALAARAASSDFAAASNTNDSSAAASAADAELGVHASLPADLAETELRDGLVAVVATDIDTDGDLDIVATDRALNVYVWINDGAGHFTRRAPARSPNWGSDPAGSTIDDRAPAIELFTQNTRPSVGTPALSQTAALVHSVEPLESATGSMATASRSVGPPRAPPASAFLT
jgi:hypothetical protein